MNEIISNMTTTLIALGADNLMAIMIVVFFIGIILKLLMYFLLKSEADFSSAFETRTHRFLNREYQDVGKLRNFHETVAYLLKRTFNESYILRRKQFRKRREDPKVNTINRMFLIETGAKTLIEDTLKQTRYHDADKAPDFRNISRFVYGSNPYFNKLWGVVPVGLMNNIFSRLPSLFIIGGIFGTFLGISNGLPALKEIDPGDIIAAQATLADFLQSMTFAMYSSVVGIFLSVCFTILNAFTSLESIYLGSVDRYTQSLELIWKDTNSSNYQAAVVSHA
jgi:Flp pilus assembly protein protease CpaA